MNKNTFLVSEESINSHGLKVITEGINLERFEKNPIMLYNHERTNIIGRWENLTITDGKLYADAIFDEQDTLGKEIARKVKDGFIKATSLGISYSYEDLEDEVIKKSTLMEISIVPVGSNKNALKLYDNIYLSECFVSASQSIQAIGKTLNLSDINKENIINAISTLKEENQKYKDAEKEKNKEFVNNEVNKAIRLGKFTALEKEDFIVLGLGNLKLFKSTLQRLPNKSSLLNQLKVPKEKQSKANWSLDDYRQYAPEELEQNPELYKELVTQKFNKQ
ncbi:HK97 family phage prohead protease [Tenacibaculum maritimum]|nr:HK97 family phage prohead protease [Tenacibaculum maritimum]MDB0601617.1 HK97 family phage prohead protease [Tenacibaculum maritimum]MDB0601674.1 HK97 family phage prohead protease [Tenacibaculum maritimum]MDB0612861.1 HK97 family phage prohead protease [Tenacibaculum maritimum]